jgi:tetratricopeptide (TPR) repeat protein
MVLETFSVSHGKASAYLPIIDLRHTYFDIKSEDDARKRREKVTGRVVALDQSLEDALPYLFALLGIVEGEDPLAQMDGQIKKRRTLDAIKRILLRESMNQPLMVIFEDLHWIDEQTQEFLNLLADSIANAKILLLVNYRPQYSHQWNSKTYYTQLRLDPLGKESADEMLSALLDDHLSELAHHYGRSANRAKAVEFLHRAGGQAFKRASYGEGESYFAAALKVLEAMPESPERDGRELRVRSALARSMAASKGWGAPEMLEMAGRARSLAEKTANLPALVRQLFTETNYAVVRGDFSAAAVLADELLEVAQREGSPASLVLRHNMQFQARFYRGDCRGAAEHFERGRAFFDAPGFPQVRGAEVLAFGIASWLAWMTGRADTARERVRRCLEGTQRNPYDVAFGQMYAAFLYGLLGEFERAEALAAKALAQSEERGFPEVALWSVVMLGRARGELGRTGEGVALLHQSVASATESGARIGIVSTLTWLAWVQMLDGKIADALGTIEDALRANPEELWYRPETYRVRGELQLKQGNGGLAEADFREAIALAQKMGAKALELRATTSLAHLLCDTGRRNEARTMLADIYNRFTEGFDTADLIDAKALLDELGR